MYNKNNIMDEELISGGTPQEINFKDELDPQLNKLRPIGKITLTEPNEILQD